MPYDDDLLCPGAPPWTEGAMVFGVVSRIGGRLQVDWLETATPATPDVLALTGDTPPASVLRTAAKCRESSCAHFDGDECQLIGRLVTALAPVSSARLPCPIRGECRWFWQEGLAACGRCSQLATQDDHADTSLREAARPR